MSGFGVGGFGALAHVAKADGWISIEEDEELPVGAARIRLVESAHVESSDAGTKAKRAPLYEHTYPVPRRTQIRVKEGQWVEAGDLLTVGSAFPTDVLDAAGGINLGVDGDVTAVSVKDEKKTGTRWMTVEIMSTEGEKEVRHLRVPDNRPDPEIVVGMEVNANIPDRKSVV